MTSRGRAMAQTSVTQVLEEHQEFAPHGLGFSDGSGFLLTYLLSPEDLVAQDARWGRLVQDPPFLLEVPLAQASLDDLRMTGRFCRCPDDT